MIQFRLFLLLLLLPALSYANFWQNLWARPDQQAAHLLAAKKPLAAAQRFQDPAWRAAALYRAGKFKAAATLYAKYNTPVANYNLGNALAKAGSYQKAILAYESALKQKPTMKDAQYNLKLIKKLLKQQQQKKSSKSAQSPNKPPPQKKSPQQNTQHKKSSHSTAQNSNSTQRSENNKSSPTQKRKSSENQSSTQQKSTAAKHRAQQKTKPSNSSSSPQQNKSANNKRAANAQKSAQTPSKDAKDTNQQATPLKSQKRQAEEKSPNPIHESPQQKLQQAKLKHWLNQVPDDPGGLLRRKFLRDYQRSEEQT